MNVEMKASDFEFMESPDGFGSSFSRNKKTGLVLADIPGTDYIRKGYYANFSARPDDVYVTTLTKAGTTWTSEMVYLINTNLDYETAKSTVTAQRFPFLTMVLNNELRVSVDQVEAMASPRHFKFHYPVYALPKSIHDNKCKIVYAARNMRDVITSSYFFFSAMKSMKFTGNFESYFEAYITDKVPFGPYWKHVLDAWNRRRDPNFLFLKYEDMKKDLPSAIRATANFLGKSLSDEQVAKLTDHCSFEKMKENPATNHSQMETDFKDDKFQFMRKGEVGDWKNYFTEDMNDRVNRYLEKHLGDVPGLNLSYEY